MVGMLLNIVAWIASSGVGAQVEDTGMHRQTVAFDQAADVAGHAAGHGGIGAIGGLKLVVDQHLLAADAHAEEAVRAADVGLLGVEHFNVFDVIALEGEAGEVGRVGLD